MLSLVLLVMAEWPFYSRVIRRSFLRADNDLRYLQSLINLDQATLSFLERGDSGSRLLYR